MPKLHHHCVLILIVLFLFTPLVFLKAEEDVTTDATEITATDIGYSEQAVNNASTESTATVEQTGTLVEIGNTTAEETTVVVRMDDGNGGNVDNTLIVNTQTTALTNEEGDKSDLSYWIAGDTIKFQGTKNVNTGELIASRIRNRAMRRVHKGVNGWVKSINKEANTIDLEWGKQIFTLTLKAAKIVAGAKNPATIEDLKVGDRIRTRVQDDGDKNPATWNAKIVVALRRGDTLFMRVTRWVVPARIVSMPDELTASSTITVEVLPNRFYQKGDVNNLVGAPGTKLQVALSAKTQLRRRFLGRCLLAEFSEGDNLQIIGRLDEKTGYLNAAAIKNNTIQRLGVSYLVSTVTEVETGSLKVKPLKGQRAFTIKLAGNAKIYKRGAGESKFSEIKIGDKIRVRGTLNRKQLTITSNVIVILAPKNSTLTSPLADQCTESPVDIKCYDKTTFATLDQKLACTKDEECTPAAMELSCQPNSANVFDCEDAKYYCGTDGFCKGCGC